MVDYLLTNWTHGYLPVEQGGMCNISRCTGYMMDMRRVGSSNPAVGQTRPQA
jgi:hypothetical protein